jgi:hypothetical protein
MMRVPATEAIVVVIVAAQTVLRMLATEAVVIVVLASTMPWIVAAEAVFVLVAAKAMPPMLLAETTQAGRLLAKAMLFVPATEAAHVNVLKHRLGAVPAIVEQRRGHEGRGRRQDDPGVRRRRVNSERGEDDAVQQHAMGQPRTTHLILELNIKA